MRWIPGKRQKEVAPVAIACSLEEVRQAIRQREPASLRGVVLGSWIRLRRAAANCVLACLQSVLFKRCGLRSADFRRVVVYTVGILGDNVVMLPALAALRRRYPGASITVITNCMELSSAGARGIFADSPFIDRLLIVDDRLVQRKGARIILDRRQLPDLTACDLFVNLSPLGNRGWLGAVVREIALAKMLKATYAVGFRVSTVMRTPLLRTVHPHFLKNEPRRGGEVLRPLGIEPLPWPDAMPPRPQARDSARRKLAALGITDQPFAVVHPGAKLRTQRWPARHFGTLAQRLQKQFGLKSILTGTNEEQRLVEEAWAAADGAAVSLVGQTSVAEMIELLRLASLCVTNDTGAMHLASAVGVPTVAVVSTRNTPANWFPNSANVAAVFRLCECSYCGLGDSGCEHLKCLNGISVEEVLCAVQRALHQGGDGGVVDASNPRAQE